MEQQQQEKSLFHFNKIGGDKFKIFFTNHLSYIYSAKSHLHKRLPELIDRANFIDLRHGIAETIDDVEKQIARMDAIFLLLDTEHAIDLSNGMVKMIDEAFTAIDQKSNDVVLRDLSMLFYLQNIEGLEMASFQVLELASTKLKDKRIKQLLKESYDEAKDDSVLFLMITAKYLLS